MDTYKLKFGALVKEEPRLKDLEDWVLSETARLDGVAVEADAKYRDEVDDEEYRRYEEGGGDGDVSFSRMQLYANAKHRLQPLIGFERPGEIPDPDNPPLLHSGYAWDVCTTYFDNVIHHGED